MQTSANVIAGRDAKASELNKVVADIAEIYAGGPGVPVGGVIWFWSDNTTPLNYKVCDGTIVADVDSPLNGLTVPNLIDRFVRGVANADIRATPVSGGTDSVVLTVGQMPVHSHGVNDPAHNHAVNDPGHRHALLGRNEFGQTTGARFVDWAENAPDASTDGMWPATTGIWLNNAYTGISLQNTGSGQAHTNIPAYRGLVPIMRIK